MTKILKQNLAVLLAVIMLLTIAPLGGFVGLDFGLSASAASENGYEYVVQDDGTVRITKYTGSGGDIVIPSTLGVRTVTRIGGSAFKSSSTLRSVTIPGSVTSIDSEAFRSCSNLTKVVMNYGVKTIGEKAFRECNSLASVTIPGSVTSIGAYAFENCVILKDVTIPYGVMSLGECAFYNCDKITNITIPGSVVDIGRDPANGIYYGGVFENCDALTSVTIQSGVTAIGCAMFKNCKNLKSVVIPDTVIIIKGAGLQRGAFYGCTSLKSIVIPSSVMTIGKSAFDKCENLSDVYYTGTQSQWNEIEIGDENSPLLGIRYHYNYVPHDHTDKNNDGKCDTCGTDLGTKPTNPTPSSPSANCSHMCHSSGFLGFIWKIVNFFNNIFSINQYCSCGAKHW